MPFPLNLWLIHPESDMCVAFEKAFSSLPNVQVLQTNYEQLAPHDCFVTAGNSYGIMTAGIDAAVVSRYGEGFMKKIQNRILEEYLGEQPVGTCFIEETGDACYPFIAHAPTMRTPGSIAGSDKVYRAAWSAFLAVYRYNVVAFREERPSIQTVVFPAFGTGFGVVDFDTAAKQMATAYKHYLNPPHRFDWDLVTNRERAIRSSKSE